MTEGRGPSAWSKEQGRREHGASGKICSLLSLLVEWEKIGG